MFYNKKYYIILDYKMLIISRDNDDIEWANDIENVYVYNVGKNNLETKRPHKNINYEHTYSIFDYIYNNYENLDTYIIFVILNKKKAEDISPYKISKIKNYIKNIEYLNIEFEYFSEYYETVNFKTPFNEDDNSYTIKDVYTNELLRSNDYYNQLYYNLFGEYPEDKILQYPGSISFVVSKNSIYNRTKDFYLSILNMLSYVEYPLVTRENIIINTVLEKIFTNKFINFIPNVEKYEIQPKEQEYKIEEQINKKKFVPQCDICRTEYEKHNFETVFCSKECYDKYLKFLN